MTPVDPGGTGDLLADAGITVRAPRASRKDDTTRAKPPEASAWAWCPRCGPAAARRVGLWQIAGHYVWALHNRAQERAGSVLCLASRQRLCDVPPTRCHVCRPHAAPCPGEHVGALLLRKPRRTEVAVTDATTQHAIDRVPTPVDGTCIDLHEPRPPRSTT